MTSRKTLLRIGIPVLLAVLVVFGLLVRRTYFLNKAVRLVSMRISQFERLSFVRKEAYKISFFEDSYVISVRPGESWEVFAEHRYPDRIRSDSTSLEVEMYDGVITAVFVKGVEIKPRQTFTVRLYPEGFPDQVRGIAFGSRGRWRVF